MSGGRKRGGPTSSWLVVKSYLRNLASNFLSSLVSRPNSAFAWPSGSLRRVSTISRLIAAICRNKSARARVSLDFRGIPQPYVTDGSNPGRRGLLGQEKLAARGVDVAIAPDSLQECALNSSCRPCCSWRCLGDQGSAKKACSDTPPTLNRHSMRPLFWPYLPDESAQESPRKQGVSSRSVAERRGSNGLRS